MLYNVCVFVCVFTKLSFSGFNPDLIACYIILTQNINNNLLNRNIIVFSTHSHNNIVWVSHKERYHKYCENLCVSTDYVRLCYVLHTDKKDLEKLYVPGNLFPGNVFPYCR